jgi:hypothetical protein
MPSLISSFSSCRRRSRDRLPANHAVRLLVIHVKVRAMTASDPVDGIPCRPRRSPPPRWSVAARSLTAAPSTRDRYSHCLREDVTALGKCPHKGRGLMLVIKNRSTCLLLSAKCPRIGQSGCHGTTHSQVGRIHEFKCKSRLSVCLQLRLAFSAADTSIRRPATIIRIRRLR